ncbi:ADP-ribose glycohydrolase ARH3-like [Argonauta hians]
MSKLASKFRGCLLGALVGDCLGEEFEFAAVNTEKIVKFIKKLENESPEKRKQSLCYTDDTEMRISIEESLLEKNGFDKKDMANKFAERYRVSPPVRSYGCHVPSVFMEWEKTNYSDIDGPATKQFNGSGSYGNGGGMRVAPAALFAFNQSADYLKDLSDKITLLTHTHIWGLHGAYLQALSVWLSLKTEQTDFSSKNFLSEIIRSVAFYEDQFSKSPENKDKDLSAEDCHLYCNKLEIIQSFLARTDVSNKEVVEKLGNGVAAQNSIPTALYAFLRSVEDSNLLPKYNGFEKTIIYAISLGGDTDTIATMAGAMAGAFWGEESIPKLWQECCEGLDCTKKNAQSLYEYISKQSEMK